MSDVNSEKLIQHLKEKWKGNNCPLCKSGNWNISDKIFQLTEFHDGNIIIGHGPIIPIIPITCDNCGNTVLVNSILAGTTSQPKKGN